MAWHEVQVMPACDVGWFTSSKLGSSNAPLKNGTTSWHPAHHREAFTFPSRLSATCRVSRTLNRYGLLLNELKWWALWNQPLKLSWWHSRQYWSIISALAGMKFPVAVRASDGSKYFTPSLGPTTFHCRGSW